MERGSGGYTRGVGGGEVADIDGGSDVPHRIDRGDLIDVLKARHRDIDDACTELRGLEERSELRGAMTQRVETELARHAETEEQYLYPMVRAVLPDGHQVAEYHLAEHDRVEQLVKLVERTEFPSAAHDEAVDALVTAVRRQLLHEEEDLLPRLREACPRDQLDVLGRQAEMTQPPLTPEPDSRSARLYG